MTHPHIHMNSGEIVTRRYLRRRVSNHLSKLRRLYTLEERRAAIAATVDNPDWMRGKHGYTVGAVIRAVMDTLHEQIC